MAENSKRERILEELKERCGLIPEINQVKRVRPSLSDLSNFPSTIFPLAAITAGLPQPSRPHKAATKKGVVTDYYISNLDVEIVVYDTENVEPDSRISFLADELWRVLQGNQTLDGLLLEMDIVPHPVTGVFHPYIAFKFVLKIKYSHTIGGI